MPSSFTATDAGGYELLMGRWSRRLAPLFLDFAGLRVGQRILDVGCGTGSLAAVAAERLGDGALVGVDLAEPYIAHARAAVSDPRVTFDIGDAMALGFADGEFDAALSLLVINFVPDPLQTAAEMMRVTKRGGTVAAAVWDFEGGYVVGRMFWDTAAALRPAAAALRDKAFSWPLLRAGELGSLFREAGLADVAETELTIWMRFSDFADLWQAVISGQGGMGSYAPALTEAERGRLRDALFAAYCAGRPDGPRAFAAIARAARGRVP